MSSDDSVDFHKDSSRTAKSSSAAWNKNRLRSAKRQKVKSSFTYKVRDARCLSMLKVTFGAVPMEAAVQITAVLCRVCKCTLAMVQNLRQKKCVFEHGQHVAKQRQKRDRDLVALCSLFKLQEITESIF